ncbi:MAG: hypothetical protein IJP31_00140 [Lachnospiraceae bacterium]|nr:hypothetical protein [Lachnospiraceae bacterium]
MESFFRYIAYVDYYEKGLRISNAGYLRWKMTGSRHQLEIEIKETRAGTGYYPIEEEESGAEIALLQLVNGEGSMKENYTSIERDGGLFIRLSEKELDLYRIRAFRIELEKDRILRIPLELPLPEQEKKRAEAVPTIQSPSEGKNTGKKEKENKSRKQVSDKAEREKRIRNTEVETTEGQIQQNTGREAVERQVQQNTGKEAVERQVQQNTGKEAVERQIQQNIEIETTERQIQQNTGAEAADRMVDRTVGIETTEKVHLPLEEDKWQQLCRSYPQVHPFPGGRTFLSIRPEDFVLLQENYQKLVHNSFLLHGYYNYRHMILGKLEEGEEQPYYIGVPGLFYEKEKQAAGLFGFAGFEGTEYPVRNGSQGYYMIEVKI